MASKLSRNILQSAALSGIDPSTGKYLSPSQRKAIFRRSRVSSARVFARSSNDLVAANSSAIVKYQDKASSIKLNKVISYFDKKEREDKKLKKREIRLLREQKVERQRQRELLRRKEKEEGLEGGFGKKLAKTLIAPVRATAAKTQGILQQLIDFFLVVFAGWLTDKGLLAIKLNAEGNTEELKNLAGEVGIALGAVTATLGILNGGLLGIAATIGGVALSIGGWLLTRPFSWARNLRNAGRNNPPTTPTPSSGGGSGGGQGGGGQGSGGLRGPQIGDTKTVTINGKSFKSTVVSLEPRTGMRNGVRVQLRSRPITAAEILNNPRASAKQLEDLIRFDLRQTQGYRPGSGMTQANFRRMMSTKYGKDILKDVIFDRGTGTFRFKPGTKFTPTAQTFLNRAYNPASSGFAVQRAPSINPQPGSVASRTGFGSSQTAPSIPQTPRVPAGPGLMRRLTQLVKAPMTWNVLLRGLQLIGLGFLAVELKQDWDIGDYYAVGVKILAAAAAYKISALGFKLAKAVIGLSGGLATAGGIAIGAGGIAGGIAADKYIRDTFLTPEKRKEFGVPTREELLKKSQEKAKGEEFKFDLTDQEKDAMLRSAGFPSLTGIMSPPQIQPIRQTQTNPPAVEPQTAQVNTLPIRRPIPEQLPEPAPNVIYRRVGGQQNQSTPLKSGSATDVPLIPSSNPDNFYTMYSKMNYNVVD